MKRLILFLLIALPFLGQAQDWKRTQNWYFGDSAGLSFLTDPPTVLSNGAINTIEGCATINDTNGNLLFYTNGITVWNKHHQVMDNGMGLNAHASSTQSSLIVPWPENDSLYYVFTTDALAQANGLQYSIVNINANNGLGTLISKNVMLHTPVCEKLVATYHQNGKDVWVMAHEFNSNRFLTYQVTKTGINLCPIIQGSGSKNGVSNFDAQGSMKLNSSGTLLGNVLYDQHKVELFTFDNRTAQIDLLYTLNGLFFPFAIEFSDSLLFYVIDRSKNIYQYNLNLINESDINQSKVIVGSSNALYTSSMQRSRNKIYIALYDSSFIASIEYPNNIGTQSGFVLNSIDLNNSRSYSGLPNFISSYFYHPILDFSYITNCSDDSIYFTAKSSGPLTSPSWNVFKETSLIHSSDQVSSGFRFTDTGQYKVRLIDGNDTVIKNITIEPRLDLGKDTVLCNQVSTKLILPRGLRCINWQDGSDSQSYTVTQNGTYFLSASNLTGCQVSDTINIRFSHLAAPVISRSSDTLFTDSGYTYQWLYNNNPIGADTHFIKVNQNGNYQIQITDSNGCSNISAHFQVTGLGLHTLKAENFFSIYPIPSTGMLYIEPIGPMSVESVVLIDVEGRKFHYTPASELPLHGLPRGIYFLQITDQQTRTYTTKIIIN